MLLRVMSDGADTETPTTVPRCDGCGILNEKITPIIIQDGGEGQHRTRIFGCGLLSAVKQQPSPDEVPSSATDPKEDAGEEEENAGESLSNGRRPQRGRLRKNKDPQWTSSNLSETFAIYCQETSLHGWKYVTSKSSTRLEKINWFLLLLASLTTASVLVYRAVDDFLSHTVSTNMDSFTSFENLYFPAITVCNMNFIQRSVLEKYGIQNNDTLMEVFDRMINTGTMDNFTTDELQMFEDIERMTNGSARLKMEGQPKCHNMFLAYSWRNKEVKFADGKVTMHYGQTTDKSVCCQIFPGMLPEENHLKFDVNNGTFWSAEKNPWQLIFDNFRKGISPGKQGGVKVLIDVEAFEYFSVHSSGSEGVLVLIQHYRDIPLMRKESLVLAPGFEVDVGLSITEITTTAGAISRFSPEQRDCYTHDEVNLIGLPLKKGYRMSMKNCLYDNALHEAKEECKCSPPFYVLGTLGKLPICMGTQLHCAYEIFDDVGQHHRQERNNAAAAAKLAPGGESGGERGRATSKTSCRAPCNDQVYDARVTFAAYPNRALFSKRREVCPLVEKLAKICSGWLDHSAISEYGQYPDEYKIKLDVLSSEFPNVCDNLRASGLASLVQGALANRSCSEVLRHVSQNVELAQDLYAYARKNLLWLNVYVKDSFATRIVRDEKMTRTSFVANVGGLLGLCMGFSLVSAAELMYFGLKRQVLSWCGRKRRSSRKERALTETDG